MPASLAAVCVIAAFPASAHLFNHQDRHEVCDIYRAPDVHAIDDGHTHWHHTGPSAAGHYHGAAWFEAGHTHPDVFHDPCDQAGMLAYEFSDAPTFAAPPLPDLVIGEAVAGVVDVILRDAGEGARLPLPHLTMQDALVIHGDDALARFPGSGTREDPYIVEGYHVRNVLSISDTTKCIVVRNNVVYNDVVRGPLVKPGEIVDLHALVAELTTAVDDARAELDASRDALATFEPEFAALRTQRDAWRTESADVTGEWRALTASLHADIDAQKLARADARATMRDIRATTAELREALAQHNITLPSEPAATVEPGDTLFGAFVEEVAQITNAAPQQEDVTRLRTSLDGLRATYSTQTTTLATRIVATDASRAAREAYRPTFEAFVSARDAWIADVWEPAVAHREALLSTVRDERAQLAVARVQLADATGRLADHAFEYLDQAFDTLDEIAQFVLSHVAAPDRSLAGRLVLDWNGQCVHAYHNLIQDLRVNQNNARTGYATGGLIEDNRILTVGQIRHYDGEFRQNEIGERVYIDAYLSGRAAARPLDIAPDAYPAGSPPGGPALATMKAGRAINADGFNEAWMHDNVIYGSVDLDLHGHHHGPGFFARESHYHGDLHNHARMVNATTGACAYSYPPEAPLIPGITLPLLAEEPQCLPHHDHTKRWTSIRFERNVILDPLGYGLRYEDQNHEGDDRIATSETMVELNMPHFHRTHIALADNLILGSLWVDVFNADGIELWDDDHSEVRRDITGAIIDVAEHLGARIVNSHPVRNDGWLDLTGNTVFVVDKESAVRGGHDPWSAFQVNDAKELARLDLAENRAYLVGRGFDAGADDASALAATLRATAALDPAAARERADAWGGERLAHASQGVLMRGVADSLVRVCGNAMLGFTRGLEATQEIRPDVGFQDCGDNAWGGGTIHVVSTEYPPEKARLLDPARDASAGTPAQTHVHSIADHAEVVAAAS